MTSGALCSDHVNYLILRYLQEAGHENAATAFYRDWHRQPEYRNPENYPFASVVQRGELVHVIQDGLHHDDLISRVKKNERKFRFTHAGSREVLEGRERDGSAAGLDNGAGSRPGSSGLNKRKARPPAMRPPDEFPTPAPKRQRCSEGSEGPHLNGDAMQIETEGSPVADGDEDGEAASPAVASEAEVIEIPERYDSMDVAVQTEIKTGPKTSTMYWKINRPGVTILNSLFNPDPDVKNCRALMAVGESLCAFYQVPDAHQNPQQIMGVDEPSLPPNSVITASAWHPEGHTAVCAVDTIRELSDGQQVPEQKIICYSRDSGTTEPFLFPPLLEPAGIILCLRYSRDGRYLAAVRTNLNRGVVLVYDTTRTDSNHEPIAWRITESMPLNAAWHKHGLIICGEEGLLEALRLERDIQFPTSNLLKGIIAAHGLKVEQSRLSDIPPISWDKIVYDWYNDSFAVASTKDRRLMMGRPNHLIYEDHPLHVVDIRPNCQLTASTFRPTTWYIQWNCQLLALAFDDGTVQLYKYDADYSTTSVVSVRLTDDNPALALAWSPDGHYLAVGGSDIVQIWNLDDLVRDAGWNWTEKEDSLHEPIVIWRPDPAAIKAARNGEHEDEQRPLLEPSLSWSADGEKIAFAVERQIAVINFRPPLHRKPNGKAAVENGHTEVNGHHSP